MKNKNEKTPISLKIGLGIFILIVLVSLFANFLAPYDPFTQIPEIRLSKPSSANLFGTDQYGRDILSRVIYGGRRTLAASLTALALTLIIGIFIGMISGFYGGLIDVFFMRLVDILSSFPFIVIAMLITSLFGGGFIQLLITIISIKWIPFAKLTRSITLSSKNNTSIASATLLGAKKSTIIVKELCPVVIMPNLTLATFELGNMILSISALSFFGLGVKPPIPEWGSMLSDAKAYFFQTPHIIFGPIIFIFLTVFSLNLIGESLREIKYPYDMPYI